jgi:hypothetical protein
MHTSTQWEKGVRNSRLGCLPCRTHTRWRRVARDAEELPLGWYVDRELTFCPTLTAQQQGALHAELPQEGWQLSDTPSHQHATSTCGMGCKVAGESGRSLDCALHRTQRHRL